MVITTLGDALIRTHTWARSNTHKHIIHIRHTHNTQSYSNTYAHLIALTTTTTTNEQLLNHQQINTPIANNTLIAYGLTATDKCFHHNPIHISQGVMITFSISESVSLITLAYH